MMIAEDPPLRRVGPGFSFRLHFELEFKENQILLFLLLYLTFLSIQNHALETTYRLSLWQHLHLNAKF